MIPYYEKEPGDLRIFSTGEMIFPPHLHAEAEFLLLSEGSLEVAANRSLFLLQKGDFMLLFPGSVHRYRTPPSSAGAEIQFVIAAPRLAGGFAGVLQKAHPEIPVIRRAELHPDVSYAMLRLQEEPLTNGPAYPVCSALLQLILARTLPQLSLVRNTDSNYFDLTYRVVDYITQNFSQPLSLSQAARELGVSKYHLSRVFSNRLHTSFSGYLGSIRVGQAQNLLRATDDPITKIAFDCGFESQRTFNRMFREVTGMNPSAYRNQNSAVPGGSKIV